MNVSERKIEILRKDQNDHLVFHDGDLPYFSIPTFDSLGIKNGFTTKFGGVSTGDRAELSMGCENQDPGISTENYRRVLKTLRMNEKRPVLSYQTHSSNVHVVTEEDVGKGPFKARDYVDVDGLITNMKDTALFTLHADCVPLYFYDPIKEVIALSHAGWRGTVGKIALVTVKTMEREFGTDPSDLVAAIGPSICPDCYEIGEEVAVVVRENFQGICDVSEILKEKTDGKYLLDLWKSNQSVMIHAGILQKNIFMTDICTKCNPDLLFSHRAHGLKRGLMAAVLSL